MIEPRIANAFVQANTVKGNRYLDDAGKIMNEWDDSFPEKQVGLEGLHMRNSDKALREMRVSTSTIWLAFFEPDTLQLVLDQSSNVIQKVAEIIEVEKFSRVGVRTQYVYPVGDVPKAVASLAKRIVGTYVESLVDDKSKWHALEVATDVVKENARVKLIITFVTRSQQKGNISKLPPHGVMFDIDVLTKPDESIDASRLKGFLRHAGTEVAVVLDRIAPGIMEGLG